MNKNAYIILRLCRDNKVIADRNVGRLSGHSVGRYQSISSSVDTFIIYMFVGLCNVDII